MMYFCPEDPKETVWSGLILFADSIQWCNQNAEKVTQIKGRLLYQAMILYNYVPFQNGNFS